MKNKISAVVAASGIGARTRLDIPKQFYEIDGVPILAYTVRTLCEIKKINEIIVAVPEEYLLYTSDFVKKLGLSKVSKIISGGETRQKTVLKCLCEVDGNADFVLIHDGARPFADKDDILNCIADAEKFGASAVGARCADTLKKSDFDGFITETVDRENVYRIYTPQIFKKDLILNAHENADKNAVNVTDDCALVEKYGTKVKITETERNNLKITTRDDIMYAEAVLKWE